MLPRYVGLFLISKCQEERQEADAYATGKEPTILVLDPNVLT
jgi:hypothetical protein